MIIFFLSEISDAQGPLIDIKQKYLLVLSCCRMEWYIYSLKICMNFMHTFMIAQNDTTLKLLIFRIFPHSSLPQSITKIKIQLKFNFQKKKIKK